jgi:hypothetical protein
MLAPQVVFHDMAADMSSFICVDFRTVLFKRTCCDGDKAQRCTPSAFHAGSFEKSIARLAIAVVFFVGGDHRLALQVNDSCSCGVHDCKLCT